MGVKTNVDGISIAPLKTALQYAGDDLGIDVATASYSEICEALAEAYPEFTGVIYDAGVFSVSYDNSGYVRAAGYVSAGGATLNASSITFSAPSFVNDKVLIIDKIDYTDYDYIHVLCNGTTYTIDVTSVTGMAYLYIEAMQNGSSIYYLTFGLCSQKTNYSQNVVDSKYLDISAGSSSSVITSKAITKVWLE